MKSYTHPKRHITIIQRKDGRMYNKLWVYFRKILRNENEEKIWKNYQSQTFFSKNVVNNKDNKGLKTKK